MPFFSEICPFLVKKGESDSKYRDSRPKTRLGLGIGLILHESSSLGLGLGLVLTS